MAVFSAGSLLAQDCRVDVVVDMTEAGRAVARPTAERPVCYFPFARGYREMGEVRPGQQALPAAESIEHLFFQALAADNYLLPTKQSAPSLLFVFEWGYIVPHVGRATGAGGRTEMSGNSSETDFALNLVGGQWLTSAAADDLDLQKGILTDAAKLPRYFVMITALDFKASLQKKKVLLWVARASTEAAGLSLADAIPTLISAGVPKFGKATVKPILFAAPIVRGN